MITYCNMAYLSRERWISFWYQILEVNKFSPKTVLEIGPGSGIVIRTLEDMAIKTTALDIDRNTKPNIIGNIIRLPFKNNIFDVVLAAEILEHIPFSNFGVALSEISRVAKKGIVITLPHFHQFASSIALKVFPFVPRFQKVFPITFPIKHRFDGQHYWEIGKTGYSLSKIKSILIKTENFKLVKDYLIEENPYHHVFVLIKK